MEHKFRLGIIFEEVIIICPSLLGRNCETRTQKYCFSHPCQNNGTCFENETSYNCSCQAGFTGRHCETEINQCASMVCENNATCHRIAPTRFECHCKEGFTGVHCQYLQRVNFDKDSFIKLPSLANKRNYSISLSFSTTVKNGLLLYQGKV